MTTADSREGRYKFHYINTTPLEPIVERWLKKTGKDTDGLGVPAGRTNPVKTGTGRKEST